MNIFYFIVATYIDLYVQDLEMKDATYGNCTVKYRKRFR